MSSEIKWIKITTDMFEDEKIDFIASLPESDAIIVIWIRLLTLAGKCNAGGFVFLTEKIPYTEEMLAHKFKKPLNVVKLALETFKRLEMIDYDGDMIFFPNWEKHQNIEGMEKIKLQNRKRKQKEREKKRLLIQNDQCHVTVTDKSQPIHATDIDIDLDKEKEKKEEDISQPETIIDAYYYAFKKWNTTGPMEGYFRELLNRGIHEQFVIEVILEMGERGIDPNVEYMRKMAEDWHSKGIKTRAEAKEIRERLKGGQASEKHGTSTKGVQSGGHQAQGNGSRPKSYVSRNPFLTDEDYADMPKVSG